jgi:hypothetical protein
MTSPEFIIWLKGFTEACNDFTATPKQWDRIKEVLHEVKDYDDNPDLDQEIERSFNDWYPIEYTTGSGSISISGSTSTYNNVVWSDQRGSWHYTNNPEGFGYYDANNTTDIKNKKELLND